MSRRRLPAVEILMPDGEVFSTPDGTLYVEMTARVLAAFGDALMDWAMTGKHGWVELGALAAPHARVNLARQSSLYEAANAYWSALLEATDVLCLRLDNPGRRRLPDTSGLGQGLMSDAAALALDKFRDAHRAFGEEISRYLANASAVLDAFSRAAKK